MKNKKITFLISSLAGGGAEGVCVNVANGLADIGWDITLVVLNMNNSVYHNRLNKKVSLVILDVKHARYASPALLKHIRKEQPEKIVAFNYELAVLLVVLRSFFFIKVKVIARNINTFSHNATQGKGVWQQYIVKPLINHFYGKADHVINQCQAMRDDLVSVFPHLADKTSVIYNPVAQHVEDYVQAHDLTKIEKKDYLLCVGRLEKQKAFHLAIEAFSLFVRANPEAQTRLKIVGQGSLEPDLRKLVLDLNLIERVDFEGFQADIIPYYLHAKATLLTSHYEGFPNVLIESITLGTPVIAFDCPSGPKEIIQDGVNGYLVKYQCVDGMVKSLISLMLEKKDLGMILSTAAIYQRSVIVTKYINVILNKINK